jgi:hypothetical protein
MHMRTQHHHAVGGYGFDLLADALHIVAQQPQQVAHYDGDSLVAHLHDDRARPNIVVDAASVRAVRCE